MQASEAEQRVDEQKRAQAVAEAEVNSLKPGRSIYIKRGSLLIKVSKEEALTQLQLKK